MNSIELCAGAGGQALGLHQAGFEHLDLVEVDPWAHKTLKLNNEALDLNWNLSDVPLDLNAYADSDLTRFLGRVDLVAGGVPCPPFSKAGKQLGGEDERDLFPAALRVIESVMPTAVMLENVQGLMEEKFSAYRNNVLSQLGLLGYRGEWSILNASDFGVPQLRPRAILVAFLGDAFDHFQWPQRLANRVTVGEALFDIMASRGWAGAEDWRDGANKVAPTLVGGSKKHGGPDLGPSRAKAQWHELGVNAHRVGNDDEIPDENFLGARLRDGTIRPGFELMPLINVRMAARLQGFPDYWQFSGAKTNAYRQVGNAFPPPVAEAVGHCIAAAIVAAGLAQAA